jgi:tetratricopeptide (TPR) repeat protein
MTLTPSQQNGDCTSVCLDAELLASYVDGRATPTERTVAEAHLAQCEDCYFAFSETIRTQIHADGASKKTKWLRWATRATAGLAAAAALIVAVMLGTGNNSHPASNLTLALNNLDAAAGPYRQFGPRLTTNPTYRELTPSTRSAAQTAETVPALLEAAAIVEKAAAPGTGAQERRALAAMYFALGRAQRAADVLAPEAQSKDAGVLSDVAAAYLARRADGDVEHALDLLERAVRLDPKRTEAWFNLGLAAEAARQLPRAQEAWTHYLVLDPSSDWATEARWHLEKLQK